MERWWTDVPDLDGSPADLCWAVQQGATEYEVSKFFVADLSGGCVSTASADNCVTPSKNPSLGEVFFYLVRALAPLTGSLGTDFAGVERIAPVSCAGGPF